MTANGASTLRWSLCFALALSAHVGGAAALLARWQNEGENLPNAPVVMLELAPVPAAPTTVPNDIPPGPQAAEAQAEPEPVKPVEMAELPPAPQAELPLTPPPKPVDKAKDKPKQKRASAASAPSSAERRAERAAAPAPGANSHDPNALPSWKSQLVAKLERYKRYPSDAQSRGEQGVAHLAFSVDRSGGVHNARIVQSSGSTALDHETLAMVERAQPLPPPPPEIAGPQIPIVVPIRYNFR